MKQTSVYLPEALKERLTEVARRTGRPEAQLIRQAVERLVAAEPGAIAPVARRALVGMPTTVFVSPDGQIAGRYLGEMSQDTLDGLLDQLVAAR